MSSTRAYLADRGVRVDAHRAAAERARGVLDDGPHVLPDGPPEQQQEPLLALDDDHARLARDRAGTETAGRCDLGAKVERAEPRDHLPGLGAKDRERREAR